MKERRSKRKYGRRFFSSYLRCLLQITVYASMSIAITSLLLSLFYLEFEEYAPPVPVRPSPGPTSRPSAASIATAEPEPKPEPEPKGPKEPSAPASPLSLPPCMPNPAVVVVAHNREGYLKQSLSALLRAAGSDLFQIYVSLDSPGDYGRMELAVGGAVREYMDGSQAADPGLKFLRMRPRSDTAFERSGIGRISRHHEFALEQGLQVEGHSHLIVLEEDLVAAPDFFSLFVATAPLLEHDSSLFCVSAWNDNGMSGVAWDPRRLYRTDYFAGLGWMIKRSEWAGRLRAKWPAVPSTGWDHWMRLPTSNDNRECVVPEVSRTKHIGDQGVNVKSGQQNIYSRWAFSGAGDAEDGGRHFGDLSYLRRDRYEEDVESLVKLAYEAGTIEFYTLESWAMIAAKHQLWKNQPRGTHRGLILVHNRDGTFKVLADKRKAADYLRPEDAWRPNPDAQHVPGGRGESCNAVCSKRGLRCDHRELQFSNTCERMLRAFPCEAGCGHQMGYEIPSYVVAPNERTYRQCLVADEVASTCQAQHPITRRLCACLPM